MIHDSSLCSQEGACAVAALKRFSCTFMAFSCIHSTANGFFALLHSRLLGQTGGFGLLPQLGRL